MTLEAANPGGAVTAEEEVKTAMKGLSSLQKQAILHRQVAMFAPDAVFGRGATTASLRRRGIIKGAMPYARLTQVGEVVAQRLQQRAQPSTDAEGTSDG